MGLHFQIVRHTARDAIRMWHQQYGFASRKLADGSDSGEISKKLSDLKRPTKAQVDKIIGGPIKAGGWTSVL